MSVFVKPKAFSEISTDGASSLLQLIDNASAWVASAFSASASAQWIEEAQLSFRPLYCTRSVSHHVVHSCAAGAVRRQFARFFFSGNANTT